jgi:alkanesulfonate monooxygenase
VSPQSTLLVIEGEISPSFVVEFAQAHEAAGFDMALVGYSSSSAEGFLVASYAAARTERMSYLVAHRPGFVAPTLFARKVATFDQLTGGRLALHIITGKTDAEQEGDGDFTPKAERYQRAQEYLHLVKRTWATEKPFDFDGQFYRVRGAHSDVRPLQKPHPLIMFGGASEGALEMGSAECDVFAIYAEPPLPPLSVLRLSAHALQNTTALSASTCLSARLLPRRKRRRGTKRTAFSPA